MNESQLFERLGRQHVVIENQNAAYSQLLALLAGVVGGKIDRRRVLVNLTDSSWDLCPEGLTQGMPGTINGKPVCVVAPAPPPPAPPPVPPMPMPAPINGLPAVEPNEHPRPEAAE